MSRSQRRRPGFTLVELLVVIVVIGILVALLVPVIASAIRKAHEAQVSAEINTLAQSLQSFKTKYGDFPPSRIVLMENGYFQTANTAPVNDPSITYYGTGRPTNNDIAFGALAQRSLRYLRKFFPRATFSTSAPIFSGTPSVWYDFNGDGVFQGGTPIYLEGHECLVFFLGGIPNATGSAATGYSFQGMGGFLNSPANPFINETVAANPRSRPLFEFKADRLYDEDNDGIPGYLDPLGTQTDGRPYLYFSSYGGGSYDPNDVNVPPTGSDDSGTGQGFGGVASPAPNPYTVGPSVPAAGRPKYVNPESYQLLSAGRDRMYGVGGQYDSSGNGDKLPTDTTGRSPALANRERDNITNFSSGTID